MSLQKGGWKDKRAVRVETAFHSRSGAFAGLRWRESGALAIGFDRLGEKLHFAGMSAQEIIAELPKLDPVELRLVREKLAELEAVASRAPQTGWGAALLEIAGCADDLPADLSVNHDHYLYGTPKRE